MQKHQDTNHNTMPLKVHIPIQFLTIRSREMSYNSELKQWSGPTGQPIYNPRATVGDILYHLLTIQSERIIEFYPEDNSCLTYGELKLKSTRVALNLHSLGIRQGDAVSIMCFDHKNVSSIIFGCTLAGAPFNCVHLEYGIDELVPRLLMIKPKIFICDSPRRETVQAAIKKSGLSTLLLTFDEDNEVDRTCWYSLCRCFAGDESDMEEPVKEKNVNTVAVLLRAVPGEENFVPSVIFEDSRKAPFCYHLTSGTTGLSKVVCLTHAHFIAQALCIPSLAPPGGTILFYCPISWMTLIILMFNITTVGAARIILPCMIAYDRLAMISQKYKADAFFTLPIYTTQFVNYLEQKSIFLDSIKIFLSTGYPLFEDTKQIIKKHIPNGIVVVAYGLSECLGVTRNISMKPGSSGEPYPRIVIKIVNDDEERLGPNQTGEICVKCLVPFNGYFLEEINKTAFDAEGFLLTGDLGHFDDDGSLFVEGRKKDLIKHKGLALNANTIEEFILAETGLNQCCVVGLDDPVHGDELPAAAIIVPLDSKYIPEDIEKLVAAKLPEHKHLTGGVYFVNELPYTSSGKLQRHEVKKLLIKLK